MDVFVPLQLFSDYITYHVLHFTHESYVGSALNFFIFDTIKISLLLVIINYVMAFTRYYFPMEKVRDMLVKRRWFGLDYIFAALLGVVTPFCSCSSIPLFIGFIGAGIPLGVTFAFLISSPLINESSLYLFPVMFGMKVTVLYNLVGIVVAIIGGLVIQLLHVEKYVKPEFLTFKSRQQVEIEHGGSLPFRQLISYFWSDGIAITRQLFPYVLFGVGIGAMVHGFMPSSLVEKYLSAKTWWTIPIATLLGAPLYANSISVVPVMEALIGKGIPIGTALAFMTSIVTVSVPEMLILKRVMRWQLLGIFFAITVIGIMFMGYTFNVLF